MYSAQSPSQPRNWRSLLFQGASVATVAFLVQALAAGAAYAADSEQQIRKGEIVVTGAIPDDYVIQDQDSMARFDLSLRETPQAVSVVTRAQIEDFQLDTVDDILRQTTGVNVDSAETDRTYYNARGFDIVNFQFDGIGQPLSYGLQTGQIDTALFDRVEVVRGATGLLSMTGNPSAAINFVRKRPTRNLGGYATQSYGSYDQLRGDVDVNAPLNEEGSVRVRFVGAYETGDSYLDFYQSSRLTLYGVAAADLGPRTILTAGYSWQESDPRGVNWGALPFLYADGTPASYARSTNSAQPWTRWDTIDRNFFSDITHDFGGGWNAKISVLRRARGQDAKLFYIYGAQYPDTGLGLYSYPGAYLDKLRETTLDAHVTGKLHIAGRDHEVVLGVNHGRSHVIESEALDISAIGISLPGDTAFSGTFAYPDWGDYTLQADYTTKITSAYGLARLSLADPLKLMLGGNVTHAERAGVSYDAPFVFDQTKFLPFAGLTLDLTRNLTAYASFATIFSPQVNLDRNGSILDPLEGHTYEAGIKGEWNDGKLTAGVALFQTEQKNVAESLGFDTTIGQTLYEGVDASSKGVEVDLAGEALPGLELSGGYAYAHIEDNDGNAARTFIPRHTVRMSMVYTPPSFAKLRLGASARYQSRIYHVYEDFITPGEDATMRQKGYAIVDLMARYQLFKNLSLALNVDNVTDVKYWSSLQWDQAYYGAPRTVSATLGANF